MTIKRPRSLTKGISSHPLYKVRRGMINRCYRKKNKDYQRYGGRGIRVCKEWLTSQESFISYCESIGWGPGLQMDRIDNDGNYEPSNIRFVPPKENTRNTRRNVHLTINGVSKVLEDWCMFFGIPSNVYHSRVKNGWTMDDAFSIPVNQVPCGRKGTNLSENDKDEIRRLYKGKIMGKTRLAKKFKVGAATIDFILNKINKI